MPPPESAESRYLCNAAELLTRTSPSTSAHLLSAHTQSLHEGWKPVNVRQQKHHCAACGSIRQASNTKCTDVKPEGKSRAPEFGLSGGAKIYKCLCCNHRTVFPRKRILSKPPSRASTAAAASTTSASLSLSSTKESSPQTPPLAASESQPQKSADNASSKKRAKARKKGGLQALLASKQQRSQPSLDLFDFLQ